MLFSGCKDTQIALHTPIIVVADVIGDHLNQLLLAGEAISVVTFALQDAPEPLHGPIINALGYAGHTLCHSSLLQFLMECSVCILKPSIRMKDRVSIRIHLHGLVKGLEYKRVVVSGSNDERDDAAVI